jgi:hypothetical protein
VSDAATVSPLPDLGEGPGYPRSGWMRASLPPGVVDAAPSPTRTHRFLGNKRGALACAGSRLLGATPRTVRSTAPARQRTTDRPATPAPTTATQAPTASRRENPPAALWPLPSALCPLPSALRPAPARHCSMARRGRSGEETGRGRSRRSACSAARAARVRRQAGQSATCAVTMAASSSDSRPSRGRESSSSTCRQLMGLLLRPPRVAMRPGHDAPSAARTPPGWASSPAPARSRPCSIPPAPSGAGLLAGGAAAG